MSADRLMRSCFPAGTLDTELDFLPPLVNEGDSYGSRRGVFCFIADCLPGELR